LNITQVTTSSIDNFCIGNNIYIAGIPKRVTEEDLIRVFEKYGTI